MTNCRVCDKSVDMPFVCKYCSGMFCAEHRLPEAHNCTWVSEQHNKTEQKESKAPRKPPQRKEFITEGEFHFAKNESHKPTKPTKSKKSRVWSITGRVLGIIGGLLILLFVGLFFFAPVLFNQVLMPTTVNVDQVENKIFELINEERNERGLPTLLKDSNLELIAKQWSDDLVEMGKLTHGDFSQRVAQIGYSNYQCGEIIIWQEGWTWDIAQDFVDGWIESSEHYEIMMTPSTGYMGIGFSKEGANFYGVVDFRFN